VDNSDGDRPLLLSVMRFMVTEKIVDGSSTSHSRWKKIPQQKSWEIFSR